MTSCVFTELTEICKSASQKSVLVSIIHVGYLFCESPVLWKISVIRWHYHWTIFVSKKLEQDLKPKEIKLPIIKQQCIVYTFSCDLYTYADNVGYTARHLYQWIVEHKNLAIRKLLAEAHGQLDNPIEDQSAKVSNKVWMPNSWNAVYKRDEAKLEHPGRSNLCKTIHLNYRSWHFILGFQWSFVYLVLILCNRHLFFDLIMMLVECQNIVFLTF